MKKRFLSFTTILFFLISCNIPENPPSQTTIPAKDSSNAIKDTVSTARSYNIGTGLTLEEMKDDSVFIDGSIPTSWEVAGITDVKGFKLFLKNVQLLVFNNDKELLSKLIRYPLGKSVKNEKDFIKNFDRLFTKDVKLSIANINFSQVFRNSKGATTEGGKVWFSQVDEGFKIIAINS